MKYLIEIHHGIGDIVQITGLIDTIYNMDSMSEIGVIVNSKGNGTIFDGDYRVKNIYYINIREMPKIELFKMIQNIRNKHYDYAFFSPISNHRDTPLLAILCGAKRSFGEQFSFLSSISKKYIYVPRKDVHIVERNNNILLASGLTDKVSNPKLIGIEDLKVKKIKSKVVGICIGTSKPAKTWPLERFLKIAEMLEEQGYQIIFIGGKEEANKVSDDLWELHPNWQNYMGKTSLMQSTSLTKICDIVLGGDTGIMHMAAAVGTPTVTIFSCSNPQYHAPYSAKSYYITAGIECQYCYSTGGFENCLEYMCLNNILVEEVFQVIQCALDNTVDTHYCFTC